MPETNSYLIKDSGDRRSFGTGAVRDVIPNKGRFDLLPWDVIRALAIHYQRGCEKYGPRNWEKGINVSSFLDSGIRHAAQVVVGMNDENHLIAGIWNLCCAYQTILWIQEGRLPLTFLNDKQEMIELYDLPRKITLPDPYGRYSYATWQDVVKALQPKPLKI
jgi:hypothetical protein